MLGVPASPGAVGWALLVGGVVAAALAFLVLRRRVGSMPTVAAFASACLILTVAAVPYVLWRFADDLRVTTKLHGYDAQAAGPVQAFLPGYLVDGAQRFIPRDATFTTAVGPGIPWASARAAFPSLALETLFPRRSVADAASADYIVSWGIPPGRVAPVSRSWVARPRAGEYAAVYVGRVRR